MIIPDWVIDSAHILSNYSSHPVTQIQDAILYDINKFGPEIAQKKWTKIEGDYLQKRTRNKVKE